MDFNFIDGFSSLDPIREKINQLKANLDEKSRKQIEEKFELGMESTISELNDTLQQVLKDAANGKAPNKDKVDSVTKKATDYANSIIKEMHGNSNNNTI